MTKPRLTEKRLQGLGAMAGLIEAGPSLEETFYDVADEVRAALNWIREMQAWTIERQGVQAETDG